MARLGVGCLSAKLDAEHYVKCFVCLLVHVNAFCLNVFTFNTLCSAASGEICTCCPKLRAELSWQAGNRARN